jgi:hypothetical protein
MRIMGMGRIVAGVCAAALAGLAFVAAGARAEGERSPIVVELFTSQGCSSCPPADRLLSDLAERDGIIALALHVDYWDYIGWKDSFAEPEHTARQRAYARAAGERMIYTPQMIVGGTHRVVGARAMKVVSAIESHEAAPSPVSVQIERDGDNLSVEAAAPSATQGEMVVQLVRYRPEATVKILRGENAGRTLTYSNIVTSWEVVRAWSGAAPLQLTLPVPGEEPAVVIVQEAGHGAILGAATTR